MGRGRPSVAGTWGIPDTGKWRLQAHLRGATMPWYRLGYPAVQFMENREACWRRCSGPSSMVQDRCRGRSARMELRVDPMVEDAIATIVHDIIEPTTDTFGSFENSDIERGVKRYSKELNLIRDRLASRNCDVSDNDIFVTIRATASCSGFPSAYDSRFEALSVALGWYLLPATIYIPLNGLRGLPYDMLQFGEVLFTSGLLPALNDYISEYHHLYPKQCRSASWAMQVGTPLLTIRLPRTLDAVSKDWATLARRALALLRLVQMFENGRPGWLGANRYQRITLGVGPRDGLQDMLLVNDGEKQTKHSGFRALAPSLELEGFARHIRFFRRGEITREGLIYDVVVNAVAERLKLACTLNDFEERFFRALDVFDKSYNSDDPREVIMYSAIILEILYNQYQGPQVNGIKNSIATTLSLLLTPESEERRKIENDVTQLYNVRSQVVHEWSSKRLTSKQVKASDKLALRGLALAGQLLDRVDSRDDLSKMLKEGFRTIRLPIWGSAGRPPQ